MMTFVNIFCGILILGLNDVFGWPSGAPSSTCDSLWPIHGAAPQNGPSPYQITLSSPKVKPGDNVTVTITSQGNKTPFKGFFLQARRGTKPTQILGEFTIVPETNGRTLAQYRSCGHGKNNGVTQVTGESKFRTSFIWTAPRIPNYTVSFRSAVVKDKNTFWTNVQSQDLVVNAE